MNPMKLVDSCRAIVRGITIGAVLGALVVIFIGNTELPDGYSLPAPTNYPAIVISR
jgi:hypothetical protein